MIDYGVIYNFSSYYNSFNFFIYTDYSGYLLILLLYGKIDKNKNLL